ncbi:MAG: hypothetical protein JSS98_18310 [Bacteroidetes bacterium]|nr:hypothetical protein [Bacteroidota bacterium]
MNYLNVQTIYKSSITFENASSDVNATLVNISSEFLDKSSLKVSVQNNPSVSLVGVGIDSDSNLKVNLNASAFNDGSGNLKVHETKNIYDASGFLYVDNAGGNSTLQSIYNCVNTRDSARLNSGAINAYTNSSSADLSLIPVRVLTIFGNTSAPCNLTLLFSNDRITWYPSQYSYEIKSGNLNFGFAIQACPNYLCMQSDTTLTTFNAFINYS